MQEQIVSFDTAKLAKEKGFNYVKANVYGDNLFYYTDEPEKPASALNNNIIKSKCLAPTQALLQKWLRDVCTIEVSTYRAYHFCGALCECQKECVRKEKIGKKYRYRINRVTEKTLFSTYEEALERGLFEALKLINND